MSNTFYNLSNTEKRNLFEEIKNKTGLPTYAIEKDWWVTQRLKEYIVKGFSLNDDRFKSGNSMNYFNEKGEIKRKQRGYEGIEKIQRNKLVINIEKLGVFQSEAGSSY